MDTLDFYKNGYMIIENIYSLNRKIQKSSKIYSQNKTIKFSEINSDFLSIEHFKSFNQRQQYMKI